MLAKHKISFPYKQIEVKPFLSSSKVLTIFRPIIPIVIIYKQKLVTFEAMIDSGADSNVFHGDVAAYLGIKLTAGSKHNISGISGNPIKGYEHMVTLRINGRHFNSKIVFSNQIPNNAIAVLGNRGFFDKFLVKFDYRNQLVELGY